MQGSQPLKLIIFLCIQSIPLSLNDTKNTSNELENMQEDNEEVRAIIDMIISRVVCDVNCGAESMPDGSASLDLDDLTNMNTMADVSSDVDKRLADEIVSIDDIENIMGIRYCVLIPLILLQANI